jgi:hypothetical protein
MGLHQPHACVRERHLLTSIADALALAAAQPDLSDGSRPEHEICVMSLSPHTEAVSIDNTDGVLGGHLLVGFQPSVPQNVCPLAPGVPIFDASGPPGGWDLEIVSLQSDQVVGRVGACPVAGPVVFAEGTSVAVGTTVVLGATGPLFSFAGTGVPEHLSLISSRFDAGLGPVVSGGSQVFIYAVEIAGFHSIGAPLIGGGGAQHRRHGAVRQCG